MPAKSREEKNEFIDPAEEIAFIRQKASSLSIRGHYSECVKLIEDNIKLLYFKDRWPENFFSAMQVHKKCYPSLNRSEDYEDYTRTLLRKNGIPGVFADFLKAGVRRPDEWKAGHFREKALELRSSGESGKALDYAELLIKLEPHSTNAYLIKGWLLEDLNRDKEAQDCFLQALELTPSNFQASQGLARQYGKADPQKALSYLNEAIEDFPDEDGFLVEKARLLEKLGDRDGALATWDKAIEIGPYQADYPYEKAELLLAAKSEVAALSMYRRAISLNEKHLPSHKRMTELSESKNPAAALSHITIVTRAEPGNIAARLTRARLLRKTGDTDNAIRQYKKILEIDEKNIEALSGMAGCYRRSDPEKALEYYELALKIKPDDAPCHLGRAEMLDILKRRDDAIDGYKTASNLDKRNPKPLGALGRLYGGSDPNLSLGYFTSAIKLDNANAEYYTGQAEAQLKLGKEAEATENIAIACRYDPGNAALHEQAGWLLERAGNRASSLIHYREALSLNPSLDRSHSGIARQLAFTEPHTALTHINMSINLNSLHSAYYYWKSRILARLGGDSHALEQLGAAAENQPEISQLLEGDNMRMALITLDRAIELSPGNNTYLCFRGTLLYDMGQHSQAMSQFERLLKADPQNHEALFSLGRILIIREDYGEAEKCLDRALALLPSSAAYHAMKARCVSCDEERYGEAIACYDTAIPMDVYAWEPVLEKARLMDSHGDYIGAMESYRRTLLIYSDCLPAIVRMGELLALSNPQAALNYLNQAVRLDSGNWLYHGWLSRVYATIGDVEKSNGEFALALELGGDNSVTWFVLAKIFSVTDRGKALEYAKKSLALGDSDVGCHILTGDIYLGMDDMDSASKHYKRAAEIERDNVKATARAAKVMLIRRDTEALSMINLALKSEPFGIDFLCLKADILEELFTGKEAEAIAVIERAVKLSPDRIDLRERLVGLLARKRAFIRLAMEKSKLGRLRKRQETMLASAVEITFETGDETPDEAKGEESEAKAESAR